MAVLLVAETDKGNLVTDATAKAVTAASRIGEVVLLVAGSSEAADVSTELLGVKTVLHVESDALSNNLPEAFASLLASLADGYTHIAGPATANVKNILPRLAALLDVMVISDVIAIENADTFTRPIYAGNALQTVRSTDRIKVLSIRTSAFDPAPLGGAAPIALVDFDETQSLSTWISEEIAESDRPELTSAKVVVSGGRGVGSGDDFTLIEKLADKMGAAVGASRAAVDAGYAPNDWQVGQTGKVVAPDLYIAVGISGAIQHLAGMKDSKVIVAINKDEEAPIFQVADYGLVADLFDAVPDLTSRL